MAGRKIHATRRILASNLRRLRKARGMSQEDLANAARLYQAEVSKIESAKLSTGIDVLQRLAKALGTRPADLLDENGS
ncbi:MAG: helix-turn-helix transcriptional regulator [Xanthobacteraceae bacterium]